LLKGIQGWDYWARGDKSPLRPHQRL